MHLLLSKLLTSQLNYFFLNPAGHFGLLPETFFTILPFTQEIDLTTTFAGALAAGAAAGAAATAAVAGATVAATAATVANSAAVATNSAMWNQNSKFKAEAVVFTIPVITATESLNMALATSAGLQTKLAAAMGLGPIASMKIFSTVMLEALGNIFKFQLGMTVGAKAAQIFGASVTAAAAAVRILWMAINTLLIPVMLAITAYQMFGDTIKEFFGYNIALQKATEESNKKDKERAETIGVAAAAMELLNKQSGDQTRSLQELAHASKVEITLLEEVTNAYKVAAEARAAITKQTALDDAKKAAEQKGNVFDERVYLLEQLALKKGISVEEKTLYTKLAKEQQEFTNGAIEQNKKQEAAALAVYAKKRELDNATKALRNVDKSDRSSDISVDATNKQTAAALALTAAEKALSDLLAARGLILENLNNKVEGGTKATSKAAQQAAAEVNARTTAEKGYEDFLTDIVKRRKELIEPGSGLKDTRTEAAINNLKALAAVTGNMETQTSGWMVVEKQLKDTVAKSAVGSQTYTKALIAQQFVTALLASGTKDFKKGLEDLNPLLKALGIAMEQSVKVATFKPYTDAAEAAFVKLKSIITSSEQGIRLIDMQLADTTRLDSRIKALQGYSDTSQLLALNIGRSNKADLEYKKAIATAEEAYQKIALKRDKDGDPKARERELAAGKEAKKVAVDIADATRKQARINNENLSTDEAIARTLGVITKEYESSERIVSIMNAKSNSLITLDKARLDAASQLNAYSERGLALRNNSIDSAKIESDYAQTTWQALRERDRASKDLKAKIVDINDLTEAEKNAQADINDIYSTKITLANIAKGVSQETLNISLATKLALAQQNEIVEKQNFALSQLETLKAREQITNDEYLARKRVLSLTNIEQAADRERAITLDTYTKDLNKLKEELGGFLVLGVDTTKTEAEIKALIEARDIQLGSMKRIKDAKVEQAEWDAKQNERQVGYTAVFKSSFEAMGDAIMEFAKTGKLNFKSLINDMIAGLVKLELKMAMTRMMEGMGGFAGIASKAISFFTGVPTPGAISASDVPMAPNGPFPSALGSVYDSPIKTFAMGGAFSNSIVSSPTLFKFASGAGLMGEAGPEAIMPLKRDPQGNLGVRGGNSGGNVEVVVNNFGSEKATTKETTDSKGNRKIEVVIGDLSAGEITRSGSSSQRALRSTFGMQPQLIRR